MAWGEYMDYVFNIAICDDDGQFVDEVADKVSEIMSKNCYKYIVHECYDGRELVEYCKNNTVDIILADIDMPNMNGFEAVEELQKRQPDLSIIFITAHNELAYQAYDYHPYQFINKTDLRKLERVLKTLVKKIQLKKNSNEIIHLQLDGIIDINVNEIMYLKSNRNYISIYSLNDDVTEIRGVIKDVYSQLSQVGFIYVQRSYIVNCRFIKDFDRKKITLKNDLEISVTRNTEMMREAQQIYGRFMRNLRW